MDMTEATEHTHLTCLNSKWIHLLWLGLQAAHPEKRPEGSQMPFLVLHKAVLLPSCSRRDSAALLPTWPLWPTGDPCSTAGITGTPHLSVPPSPWAGKTAHAGRLRVLRASAHMTFVGTGCSGHRGHTQERKPGSCAQITSGCPVQCPPQQTSGQRCPGGQMARLAWHRGERRLAWKLAALPALHSLVLQSRLEKWQQRTCRFLEKSEAGASRSGSGTPVVLRGADSVGPVFCALPRSEQLR